MTSFPYTQVRKRKRNDGNFDAGCTDENLSICNVFFLFNKRVLHEHQEENVKKIGKYIVCTYSLWKEPEKFSTYAFFQRVSCRKIYPNPT